MHGFEHATANVSKIDDEDIREFAESAQSLLKLQSQYILYLHADGVRRWKTAAFQALGMTEKEATGKELSPSVSLLGERDFARMEGTVKLRKEYQDLSRKLGDPNRKPGTGKKKFSKKKKKKKWQSRDSDNTDERTGTSRQEEGEKKETPRQEAKKSPRSTSSSNKGRGGKGK